MTRAATKVGDLAAAAGVLAGAARAARAKHVTGVWVELGAHSDGRPLVRVVMRVESSGSLASVRDYFELGTAESVARRVLAGRVRAAVAGIRSAAG